MGNEGGKDASNAKSQAVDARPQGFTEDYEYKDNSCLLKPKTEFSFN